MLLCRAAGPALGYTAFDLHLCRGVAAPRRARCTCPPALPRVESRRGEEMPLCPPRPRPCVWWPKGNPSAGLRQGYCGDVAPARTTGMSGCRKLVYVGVQDMLEGNASSPVVSVGPVACIVKWLNVSSGMSNHTPAEPSWQWGGSILPTMLGWTGTMRRVHIRPLSQVVTISKPCLLQEIKH